MEGGGVIPYPFCQQEVQFAPLLKSAGWLGERKMVTHQGQDSLDCSHQVGAAVTPLNNIKYITISDQWPIS